MDLNRGEHALDHQGYCTVSICVLLGTESVHNEEGRCLQSFGKNLRISLSLLVLNNILSEGVLINFEGDGGAFGVFNHSYVASFLSLRENHHVGDAKHASHTDKVLE